MNKNQTRCVVCGRPTPELQSWAHVQSWAWRNGWERQGESKQYICRECLKTGKDKK